MINVMLARLEARDIQMGCHFRNVAKLASAFGSYIDLSGEAIEFLYQAGLLHDIGKIGIPKYILNKPDRLTGDEYEIIKKHPHIGADILRNFAAWPGLADIVCHHHERYDGLGYPHRLAGDTIPFFSRIINLCDSYDAMVGPRCYKAALSQSAAVSEIISCQGTQFDPVLTDKFVSFISLYAQRQIRSPT